MAEVTLIDRRTVHSTPQGTSICDVTESEFLIQTVSIAWQDNKRKSKVMFKFIADVRKLILESYIYRTWTCGFIIIIILPFTKFGSFTYPKLLLIVYTTGSCLSHNVHYLHIITSIMVLFKSGTPYIRGYMLQ